MEGIIRSRKGELIVREDQDDRMEQLFNKSPDKRKENRKTKKLSKNKPEATFDKELFKKENRRLRKASKNIDEKWARDDSEELNLFDFKEED